MDGNKTKASHTCKNCTGLTKAVISHLSTQLGANSSRDASLYKNGLLLWTQSHSLST